MAKSGQYASYPDEQKAAKLDPNSKTPTFAAVRLELDNRRWHGVPFYLRSGKGLTARYSEVMIQFHCPPHLMFPLAFAGQTLRCNRIKMVIQPNESISINFQDEGTGRGRACPLRPHDFLTFNYKQAFPNQAIPEAYERVNPRRDSGRRVAIHAG